MRELMLNEANAIIQGASAEARRAGYRPLTIVVLDTGGHMKAAGREDGSGMFRIEIATGKAWAAVAMGTASRNLGEAAKGNPNFFVSLASTAQGKFLPQTGAVLIKTAEGEVLGAAGASGATGDEDEAAVIAGVKAAGFIPG